MKGHSLFRANQLGVTQNIKVRGRLIDLGAKSIDAKYYSYLDTSNITEHLFTDYFHSGDNIIKIDLNGDLPFNDNEFDNILMFNVLEHLNVNTPVLSEIHRILKPKSHAHIIIPFLFKKHNDPEDHVRYTDTAIAYQLREIGFTEWEIQPIGAGPFQAAMAIFNGPLRFKLVRLICNYICFSMDSLIQKFGFDVSSFPTGYYVVVTK